MMRAIELGIVMALAVGLPSGAWSEAATETAPQQVAVLPAITVSEVTTMSLQDRVIAGGLVGAVEEILVQPLIEGQPIEALEAEVGDYVEAGQVLARLSLTSLELQKSQLKASMASARATIAQAEAQVLEARSSADEAQRVAARTKALKANGSASQAALEQAQAAAVSATARVTVAAQVLEAARAQVELVEAQLANVELSLTRTSVVAPVAGEILARNAQIGAVASAAGLPMFTLMRDGALELRAEIAEADLVRLQPGMTARITTVGASEPLKGTVRLVEPGVNTTTRLGTARITLEDARTVRSGMYADAEILLTEHEALAVPVTAVGVGPNGATVMIVKPDGLVSQVPVQTGIRDQGMVEILTGVQAGDRVVTKAAAFVRDGDHVNPVLAGTQ